MRRLFLCPFHTLLPNCHGGKTIDKIIFTKNVDFHLNNLQ